MLNFFGWLIFFHTVLCLGTTVGYHRLLTHRSFDCPKWVEYTFATLAWLANMGPPIAWVAVHRLHHAQADRSEDPHSPVQGGWWWAHFGWVKQQMEDRKLAEQGMLPPDFNRANCFTYDTPFILKYAKDIYKDRYYRLLTFNGGYVMLALTAALCYHVGGFSMALGRLLAAVTSVWSTWYVNSYGHTAGHGYRNFDTRDASRNVWWIALLTQGEGWHNNHHHRPLSARHGMRWWEFDLSWVVISTLQRFGLASNVKAYTYEQAKERDVLKAA